MNVEPIMPVEAEQEEKARMPYMPPGLAMIPLAELGPPNRAQRRLMARQNKLYGRSEGHCVRCGHVFYGQARCQCKTSKIQHVLIG